MIKLNGIVVTPTIFPDRSSQVWRVEGISPISNHILWNFENEAEFMHVAQLVGLVHSQYPKSTTLEMPYLPYARQDKNIANDATFALHCFVAMVETLNVRVVVTDAHNSKAIPSSWVNLSVDKQIKHALDSTGADLVCFPDFGASERKYPTFERSRVVLHKKRDQQTGSIEGLQMFDEIPAGAKVLIVDDLCDRGGTFIAAAKVLLNAGASEVHLYTSHGLYTGGTKLIFDSGISRIFNKDGEVC